MKLFIATESPYRWVVLNSRHQVKDAGIATALENFRVPRGIEQVIGVVGGEKVSCHSVRIPGKRKSHVESALGYALEDRLSEDVDQLHFKLLAWNPDDVTHAAVVSREQLDSWIDKFRMEGIFLDAIIPEYFLLPIHDKTDVTLSLLDDGNICVRLSQNQGMTLDRDGFDFWWESRKSSGSRYSVTDFAFARELSNSQASENGLQSENLISHWDIGNGFDQWIQRSGVSTNIDEMNLLTGSFSPDHNVKGRNLIKLAAMICFLGFVGNLGMTVYEAKLLESEKSSIDSELREIFSTYFPNEPYLDRPKSQLSGLLDRAAADADESAFELYLLTISSVVPNHAATVEEVNYKDGDLVLLCTVQDLSSLDTIVRAFNDLGTVSAELLSSGARDGKVTGRFRLKVRASG